MTDIPGYLWLSPSGVNNAARGYADSTLYRYARGKTADEASGVLFMIAQAVPWPFTVDINGQSYPAGTVGVRVAYTSLSSDPATNNNEALIAVPSILPAAYTSRWQRDHNRGYVSLSASTGRIGKGLAIPQPTSTPFHPSTWITPSAEVVSSSQYNVGDPYRVRSAGALTPYLWLPENRGDSCFRSPLDHSQGGISIGTTPPNVPTTWFSAKTAGWRYMEWVAYFYSIGGGDFRMDLVYNADGSNTQPGDTVLQSWTMPEGDYTTTPYDSGMLGQHSVPLGTKRFYGFRIYSSVTGTWASLTGGMNLIMGARVDIPLPFTCTGLDAGGGHIIAPGGVIPGVVPGY